MMFHLVGAFAEFERNIISQRTKAGLEIARARGRFRGKPKGLSPELQKKAIQAKALYDKKKIVVDEIYKVLELKVKQLSINI